MCSPRAKFPCPMGTGHQAWARISRLIDPAPRLIGVATTRPSAGSVRRDRDEGHRHPVLDVGRGSRVARQFRALPHALRGLRALNRAAGGYEMLRRAVTLGPQGVIRELKDAKLLGRGGAAFPTAVKWEAVATNPVRPHYVVCNADESEPGTFKDRVLRRGEDPFAHFTAVGNAAPPRRAAWRPSVP